MDSPIILTTQALPSSESIRADCAVPLGGVIQPFVGPIPKRFDDIYRCPNCFGYYNPFINESFNSWRCPLCTEYASFPADPRFRDQLERKKTFECTEPYVEYILEDKTHDENNSPKILYTFVIDLSGTDEYFSSLQSNIIQSISHLPDYGSFCLITIGVRIGLYDLSQRIPRYLNGNSNYKPWKLYMLSKDNIINWNDIIKLNRFALPVKENKEKIKSIIQSLRPIKGDKSLLGECIYSLVNYIKSNNKDIYGANIFIFLNQMESNVILPNENAPQQEYDHETEYTIKDDLIESSITNGITFNMFYCIEDLPILSNWVTLISSTNGNIYHIEKENIDKITNILSHLFCSYNGYKTSLRIRSSPSIVTSFPECSSLKSDKLYDNLYHMSVVNNGISYNLEVNYGSSDYFYYDTNNSFVIQMVLSYYGYVKSSDNIEYIPANVIRVYTKRGDITSDKMTLYRKCNPKVISYYIIHSILKSYQLKDVDSVRVLFLNWLIQFYTHYNYETKPLRNVNDINMVDVKFTFHPHLLLITHIIYSLLKNDLLSNYSPADKRQYLLYFILHLSCNELTRYFYPQLYSYQTMDDNSAEIIPLSRLAMTSSKGHFFVLDGYEDVMVYSDATVEDAEIPPPENSRLYKDIEFMINNNCHCIPNVYYIESGKDECLLEKELIEDNTIYGNGYYEFEMILQKEIESDLTNNKH